MTSRGARRWRIFTPRLSEGIKEAAAGPTETLPICQILHSQLSQRVWLEGHKDCRAPRARANASLYSPVVWGGLLVPSGSRENHLRE